MGQVIRTEETAGKTSSRGAIASAGVYLAFEPSPAFIQRVVQWLTDFCHMTLVDLEAVARMQLAVNELVENVVKYGLHPDVRVEVQLVRRGEGMFLRLSTVNRAPEAELSRAVDLLTRLQEAEDPIAFYDQLIRETAPQEGVSGLGLVRIKAEGDLDVSFDLKRDELTIVVEAPVEVGGVT